jgi:YD repeat-containing protein
MKTISTLFSLFASVSLFAQYSQKEIKKFKLSKMTTLAVTTGSDAVQKNEIFYDDKGNDTAEYSNGQLVRRTTYEYNSKGQVVKRIRYKADDKEIETAEYAYKPDGSYTISNTDKDFGMTDITYCDKSGKTTKKVSPDKSERSYTYDAKGRLLRTKSNAVDNGGVIVDIQETYNANGQLFKEISKGDYKWTRTYSYNSKGMVTKCHNTSMTDGVADPEVNYSYEYEFSK